MKKVITVSIRREIDTDDAGVDHNNTAVMVIYKDEVYIGEMLNELSEEDLMIVRDTLNLAKLNLPGLIA